MWHVVQLLGSSLALSCAVLSMARADDLLQVYRDAVANDAVLATARAAFNATREKLPQATAGLLPAVNASAYSQWNEADVRLRVANAQTQNRQFNSNGLTVSLTQPLFRWQNWERYKQAQLQVAAAQAEFAQSAQELIVRVAQAYFDVLAAEDDAAFLAAQRDALAEQLALAKKSFAVGKATVTDLYDAQARYDGVIARQLTAENGVEIKKRALRQITNRHPKQLAPLKAATQLNAPLPSALTDWVERAEQENLAVRAKEAAVEIARRELTQQRAGHYPTLDLIANRSVTGAGNSTATLVGSDVQSWAIGVQLAVPLFAGGGINSRVREAIAGLERARQEAESARRAAAQNASEAFLEVMSAMSRVSGFETALKSNQVALEANRKGYSVGLRINNDVLSALQELFSTRRDLAKARYDTILSSLRLKAAAGNLGEADVEEINRVALAFE